MTKQDILNMHDSKQIMRALANNPDIWDKELSDHLRTTKRKENVERFGDADVLYTPPRRNDG
jgi:hypothetical protein